MLVQERRFGAAFFLTVIHGAKRHCEFCVRVLQHRYSDIQLQHITSVRGDPLTAPVLPASTVQRHHASTFKQTAERGSSCASLQSSAL